MLHWVWYIYWKYISSMHRNGNRHINIVNLVLHYNDVIMSAKASQITSLTIVYLSVYSGVDQRKHQSSASLACVRGIHLWPVNSPYKGRVTRKMFPFDDVIKTQCVWFDNMKDMLVQTSSYTWRYHECVIDHMLSILIWKKVSHKGFIYTVLW